MKQALFVAARFHYRGVVPSQFTFEGITLFKIKAVIRGGKISQGAASATDALRRYRELQSRPGGTSCSVMRNGVLIGQAELVSAATVEGLRAQSGL